MVIISDNELKAWYEEKKRQAYATGWRPHGLKVGDKVRLIIGEEASDSYEYAHEDDEGFYWSGDIYPDNGMIGEVIELPQDEENVLVRFKGVLHNLSLDDEGDEDEENQPSEDLPIRLDEIEIKLSTVPNTHDWHVEKVEEK